MPKVKELLKTKNLALIALLIALNVVLSRFLSFVFEIFDPSFAARSNGCGDQKCILNNQEAPDTPWK